MKRHAALIPLSRDHHHALLLAQELKIDGPRYARSSVPRDPMQKIAYVSNFFARHLAPHFDVEEQKLFPALQGRDKSMDALIAELLNDHAEMRRLSASLPMSDAPEEVMDTLGHILECHVRKEERRLFQRIQELLSDAELAALGKSIASGP